MVQGKWIYAHLIEASCNFPRGTLKRFGGDSRIRTGDLLGAIQALCQLSYIPTGVYCEILETIKLYHMVSCSHIGLQSPPGCG